MDQSRQPQLDAAAEPLRAAMQRACLILLALLLACGAYLAAISFAGGSAPFFAAHYLRSQDMLVAAVFALFWMMAPKLDLARLGLARLAPTASGLRVPLLLALAAVLVCAGGVWLVFGGYGFAIDEHWARSDATVIGTGAGMVRIPEAWRDYAGALQPRFARITPDGWWASEYLPVNAALQYLGGTLASPLLVGVAVIAAADIARRLLPEAPAAPLVCAVLMVTSSQMLVTGMTPFAMSGHLAFNLVWLWLFLQSDWRAQLAAMVAAMLAIGLHQAVYFPLYAAPFLLEAFLTGRRSAAVVQGAAIGAAFVFWSAWDSVLYTMLGAQPVIVTETGTGTGTGLLFTRAIWLVTQFTPSNIGLMAINLVRFITWQNVLVLPLVLVAAAGVIRRPGPWRAMLAALVLTSGAVMVLLADQGHGWGYRYLHGHLGSICLLATYGWYRLPPVLRESTGARALFGAGVALSLLLVPLRAWQAASFVAPYARADAVLAAIDADVVLIDAPQHSFALDLVRNDPLLRNRPKRMFAASLSDEQLARLCRDHSVARFTDADAERFGLDRVPNGLPLTRSLDACRKPR